MGWCDYFPRPEHAEINDSTLRFLLIKASLSIYSYGTYLQITEFFVSHNSHFLFSLECNKMQHVVLPSPQQATKDRKTFCLISIAQTDDILDLKISKFPENSANMPH